MTDQPERWQAVGDAIRERMNVLGLSQAELVKGSGVSDFTIRKLMRGEPGNYRADRLAKIERALDWPGSSFDDILAGDSIGTTIRKQLLERRDSEARRVQELLDIGPDDRTDAEEALLERLDHEAQITNRLLAVLDRQISGQRFHEREQLQVDMEGRHRAAALSGKLSQLSPEQLARLDAYIDGLIEGGR